MDEVIADVVNGILEGLVETVNFLTAWMPDSPFRAAIEAMRSTIGIEMLGYINYFLPVSEFLVVLSVWVSAIAAYYVVSIVLRWIKAVS